MDVVERDALLAHMRDTTGMSYKSLGAHFGISGARARDIHLYQERVNRSKPGFSVRELQLVSNSSIPDLLRCIAADLSPQQDSQ